MDKWLEHVAKTVGHRKTFHKVLAQRCWPKTDAMSLPGADEPAAKRIRVGNGGEATAGTWSENCLNQGCRSVQCFRKLNRSWAWPMYFCKSFVEPRNILRPPFFHGLLQGWSCKVGRMDLNIKSSKCAISRIDSDLVGLQEKNGRGTMMIIHTVHAR